mgnify:CR=1 FL=1
MIRAFRIRIPLLLSVGFLLASCGISLRGMAQATQIPPADFTSEIAKWAMGSGATAIAAIWALLRYHLSKSEQLQAELVAKAITTALAIHNRDEFAHPAASEHHHRPMQEQLDDIGAKLDRLVAEHDLIAGRCSQFRDDK